MTDKIHDVDVKAFEAAAEPLIAFMHKNHRNMRVVVTGTMAVMVGNVAAVMPFGDGHASDCAVHNGPAFPPGPCDCGGYLVKVGHR